MLLLMECKKIARSLVYLIFIGFVLLDFCTQFLGDISPDNIFTKPEAGVGYYGEILDPHPENIMPAATKALLDDYLNNQYTTYPIGFYRLVRLNSDKEQKIELILEKITGKTGNELKALLSAPVYSTSDTLGDSYYEYQISEPEIIVGYDEFKALMNEADSVLGGGSFYAQGAIEQHFGYVERTYEQALAEYDSFSRLDRITNGYARLWCDYHGLFLALLPVFVVAIICTLDRRSKAESVVFPRRTGSARIVLTRYAALTLMMMLPVLFTAVWGDLAVTRCYPDMQLDHLAFYKYMLIWLLPQMLAVIGADMLITEMFSGITAILIQFVWWFRNAMTFVLFGNFRSFQLILRHNTYLDRQAFFDQLDVFIRNRCFFAAAGIICALLTVWIYHCRREGKFNGFRVLPKLLAHQSKA